MNEEVESKSEIVWGTADKTKLPDTHYLEWENGVAVCTSCDFKHSTSISPEKYDLIDGKAVIKSN